MGKVVLLGLKETKPMLPVANEDTGTKVVVTTARSIVNDRGVKLKA